MSPENRFSSKAAKFAISTKEAHEDDAKPSAEKKLDVSNKKDIETTKAIALEKPAGKPRPKAVIATKPKPNAVRSLKVAMGRPPQDIETVPLTIRVRPDHIKSLKLFVAQNSEIPDFANRSALIRKLLDDFLHEQNS